MDQQYMTTIDKATHGFYCLSMRFCDAVNTKEVSPENAEEWLALMICHGEHGWKYGEATA